LHRILIIDDNPAIHADFRKVLIGPPPAGTLASFEAALFGEPEAGEKEPVFELESALQGEEGLEKVKRAAAEGRPFGLAFVDMRMPPGWDGLMTIQRLWEAAPDLPVVICSAYSEYSREEIVRALGETDRLAFVGKPFDPGAIRRLAAEMTEKGAEGGGMTKLV
jgi:CheY-like chemotaxis protein